MNKAKMFGKKVLVDSQECVYGLKKNGATYFLDCIRN